MVLISFPKQVATLLEDFLSAKRIALFLDTEDIQRLQEPEFPNSGPRSTRCEPDTPLYMRGTFSWRSPDEIFEPSGQKTFQLRDLDISFPPGKMTLIAGKMGAGKTLMLLALLGEAHVLDGDIACAASDIMGIEEGTDHPECSALTGKVAYAPQTAWLQSLSIR